MVLIFFLFSRVFRSFDGFWEYFGHFNILEVFWSFFRFRRYFGHFKISGCIYFIFRFRRYFGNFGGFMGILVFLVVLGYFRVW